MIGNQTVQHNHNHEDQYYSMGQRYEQWGRIERMLEAKEMRMLKRSDVKGWRSETIRKELGVNNINDTMRKMEMHKVVWSRIALDQSFSNKYCLAKPVSHHRYTHTYSTLSAFAVTGLS